MAYLNERVSTASKGAVSGAYYFFWGLGYFAGPLLMGKAGAAVGFATGFTWFAGLIAVQLMAISLAADGRPRTVAGFADQDDG